MGGQAQQARRLAAQQNEKAQQQQQSLIRAQLQIEFAKLQQKAKEANDELAYKYWSDRLKSEMEEATTVAEGIVSLEKAQMEGERREREALNRTESRSTGTTGN